MRKFYVLLLLALGVAGMCMAQDTADGDQAIAVSSVTINNWDGTPKSPNLPLYIGVNEDSVSNVKGGMGVGDRMAVTLESEATDDEPAKARVVVNLTTLLGKWVSLDKSFEIQEGGVVVSNITEPKPLVDWKICNGRLVLSSDTFSIYELGADSLFLENERGIYAYKRLK